MKQEPGNYFRNLYWFAIATAVTTIGLIVAGATVTSTVSGDAVPDWPLSYGSLNPPMTGGILIEHGHRLIAGFTGILIAILAFWTWKKYPTQKVRWVGIAALVGVVIQAILGGLRVLVVSTESVQEMTARLTGLTAVEPARIGITVAHASLAQTILCLVLLVVLLTSPYWINPNRKLAADRPNIMVTRLGIFLVAIIFVQLVVGAVIRHSGAGLIIPDFPLAFGKLIPPFGNIPNNPNAPFPLSDAELNFKVAMQFTHRVIAVVILTAMITFCWQLTKIRHLRLVAGTLLGLTGVQVVLGALNIWSRKSIYSTIPHVAVGALILAGTFLVSIWLLRLRKLDRFFLTDEALAADRQKFVKPASSVDVL